MNKYFLIIVLVMVFVSACEFPTAVDPNDSCSALEGSQKDGCYFDQMKCSKISHDSTRDSCVAELAFEKDDIKVCDLVQDKKTKSFCKEKFAVKTNNHELCYELEDIYWRDNCHFNLGIANEDDNWCGLVTKSTQREECYAKLALNTLNFKLCRWAGDKKASCYLTIARKTKDLSVCNKVSGAVKWTCQIRTIREIGDPDLCDKITVQSVRNDCEAMFEN